MPPPPSRTPGPASPAAGYIDPSAPCDMVPALSSTKGLDEPNGQQKVRIGSAHDYAATPKTTPSTAHRPSTQLERELTDASVEPATFSGSCRCRRVAFTVRPPLLESVFCHCAVCQVQHEAPVVHNLVFQWDQFQITEVWAGGRGVGSLGGRGLGRGGVVQAVGGGRGWQGRTPILFC